MTYEEYVPVAKELAIKTLNKGFDADAFIILTLLNEKDAVKDSEVDNKIQDMYNIFLLYVTQHDISLLSQFLDINYRMIDELYHSTINTDERDLFKTYTKKILSLNGS